MPISNLRMTLDQFKELSNLVDYSHRIMGHVDGGMIQLSSVALEWDKEKVDIILRGGEKG